MNWEKWIIASFIMFALFIGILVTLCVKQDMPLVSKEYYNDELAYQHQIERMENTNALTEKPSITLQGDQLTIAYSGFGLVEKGSITLFRPSDASMDQQFMLTNTGALEQNFTVNTALPGLYKARMQWQQQGKEYYLEEIIVL